MTEEKTPAQDMSLARQQIAAAVPTDPFMRMIQQAASASDVITLSALYDLMKRRDADQARIDFDDALARAQATFPIIPENGRLRIFSKALRDQAAREGEHVYKGHKPMQNTPYALWEDVVEGISPSLSREGLSLSFAVDTQSTGESFRIIVKGFLRRAGVTVEAQTPPLQHDASGSKNAIQAIKSTISYGKSMVAGLLVNFASRGENDDGQGGAPAEAEGAISAEQVAFIKQELEATGATLESFLASVAADSIEGMNETQYKIAEINLRRKRAIMGKS